MIGNSLKVSQGFVESLGIKSCDSQPVKRSEALPPPKKTRSFGNLRLLCAISVKSLEDMKKLASPGVIGSIGVLQDDFRALMYRIDNLGPYDKPDAVTLQEAEDLQKEFMYLDDMVHTGDFFGPVNYLDMEIDIA